MERILSCLVLVNRGVVLLGNEQVNDSAQDSSATDDCPWPVLPFPARCQVNYVLLTIFEPFVSLVCLTLDNLQARHIRLTAKETGKPN